MRYDELLEITVDCDSEAAEAVSELFNRYNGGGYLADSKAGEATGGGAVIEITGFDDFGRPIEGEYRAVVKTYIKPGAHGDDIRRKIEEGLWHLRQIWPIPEASTRVVREEDWAHVWKKHYKPLRVGNRVVMKPSWEAYRAEPGDIVVELDPGMAFGTGLHPSTRLCIRALEQIVEPEDAVLDIGTGSGVLSVVAAKLGAKVICATDIDPVAVDVARANLAINKVGTPGDGRRVEVMAGSVPEGMSRQFQVLVANILAEVLANLLDSAYGNVGLAEPMADDGVMILAGILDEKAPIVVEAGARHGLMEVDRLHEEDWVALIMRRA
ncbi:MAG: 50S ribosomal protein L11 methyltransferase [Caldilineaceae bacterium]